MSLAARRRALWGLLAAKVVGGWGLGWDIRWHVLIGRDSFWIPPHVMTYAAVAATAAIALGVLLAETWRARHAAPAPDTVRLAGLVGTRGFHLAWWGTALTILAAPIDDLWHRLFGIDVTLWSPPHLLGLAGAQISTLACLMVALEAYPAPSRGRRAALLAGGGLLFGGFAVAAGPGVRMAFLHGGLLFFTYPMVGGLLFTFALVVVARLSGARWTPLGVALAAVVFHLSGLAVSDLGFAIVRPVSTVAEVIAADPGSPIAIAHEIARRSGVPIGRSLTLPFVPVAPAAALALVDWRRRWPAASVAFGLVLTAVTGAVLARSPAFAQALPDAADVVTAAALAAGAALAGGWGGMRVAALIDPGKAARGLSSPAGAGASRPLAPTS